MALAMWLSTYHEAIRQCLNLSQKIHDYQDMLTSYESTLTGFFEGEWNIGDMLGLPQEVQGVAHSATNYFNKTLNCALRDPNTARAVAMDLKACQSPQQRQARAQQLYQMLKHRIKETIKKKYEKMVSNKSNKIQMLLKTAESQLQIWEARKQSAQKQVQAAIKDIFGGGGGGYGG